MADKEYIVWGMVKGESGPLADQPLYTLAKSMKEAESVMDVLARDHGCHTMRVQVLDLTAPPDFTKVLNI